MTPDQKPEWFQIADADNAASPRKISKGLPVMAMVAVAAILGVGAVMAQTQEQSPANAVETVATASVDSTQPAATTSSITSEKTVSAGFSNEESDDELSIGPVPTIPAVHATNSASKETIAPVAATTAPTTTAATTAPKAPSSPGIANPLGKKPKGGDHEGNEHEDEDDDEGDDD
jgi:long-subunit fatty acid transport protein